MRLLARSLAGTAAALLAVTVAAAAQPAARCTSDTLTVDAAPVALTLCVPAAAPAGDVTLTETLVRGSQRLEHTVDLEPVPGAQVTHTIDDVPLTDLGSAKQLHLTIAYRNGEAVLEHALLLPGAVVLK